MTTPKHPAIRAWREACNAVPWEYAPFIKAGDALAAALEAALVDWRKALDCGKDLLGQLAKARAALEAAEAALRRIAGPIADPLDTDDLEWWAALVREMQQIARDALERR